MSLKLTQGIGQFAPWSQGDTMLVNACLNQKNMTGSVAAPLLLTELCCAIVCLKPLK